LTKRKKRIRPATYETQYLTLENWDFTYSFGINQTKYNLGHYSEYNEIMLLGQIITEGYRYNPAYELILMGETSLDRHNDLLEGTEKQPIFVGSLQAGKERVTYIFLSMPQRALNFIVPALIANKIQEIYLYCTTIKWRKARILNFHLSTKLTGEEDK
jgi:hypothetical protein